DDLRALVLWALEDLRILLQLLTRGIYLIFRNIAVGNVFRVRAGDLQRQLPRQRLEVLATRDEVGAAIDLQQHAEVAAMVNVRGDQPLAGLALRRLHLLGARLALLFERFDRLVERPGAGEGVAAIGEARSGQLTQFGDIFRSEFHTVSSLLTSTLWCPA